MNHDSGRRSKLWPLMPSAAILVVVIALGLSALNTARLDMRPELGFDGVRYLELVDAFRGVPTDAPQAPWVFRLLPSMLVAVSGMEPVLGFFTLDVIALCATALVMLAWLRPSTTPAGALAALITWALTPFGPRYSVHYPVLTDALGMFFLLAIVWAAATRRTMLFAALLVAGVFTRESLLLCAPLLLLRVITIGWRARIGAAFAAAPAFIALGAVHAWPPIPPAPSAITTFEEVGLQAYALVHNLDGDVLRVIAAPLFAWGALTALLLSREAVRAIASEPGWVYLFVTMGVVAAIGGGDHDRYLAALAPLVVIVGVRAVAHSSAAVLWVIAVVQVIAARSLMPLGSDFPSHMAFGVGSAPLSTVIVWTAVSAACVVVAAIAVAQLPTALAFRPMRPAG